MEKLSEPEEKEFALKPILAAKPAQTDTTQLRDAGISTDRGPIRMDRGASALGS